MATRCLLSALFLLACTPLPDASAGKPAAATPAPAAAPAPAPAPKPEPAPTGAKPLGEAGYLPVAPGQVLASPAMLTPPSEEGAPAWVERSRKHFDLADGPLDAVALELPGSGAGLVFLAADGPKLRVVGTYGVRFDGNGVELAVVDQWVAPERRAALVLVQLVRESRGYQAVEGDESSAVGPGEQTSWIALGAARDRAWLASPELNHHTAARFQPQPGALQLLACLSKKSGERFALAPTTLTFSPAGAAPAGRCP